MKKIIILLIIGFMLILSGCRRTNTVEDAFLGHWELRFSKASGDCLDYYVSKDKIVQVISGKKEYMSYKIISTEEDKGILNITVRTENGFEGTHKIVFTEDRTQFKDIEKQDTQLGFGLNFKYVNSKKAP